MIDDFRFMKKEKKTAIFFIIFLTTVLLIYGVLTDRYWVLAIWLLGVGYKFLADKYFQKK